MKKILLGLLVSLPLLAETKVRNAITQAAPINAVDKGADPTNTNDSTASIQACVNAAASTAKGRCVVPSGSYKTSTTINLPLASLSPWELTLDGAVINYSGSSYALDASGTGQAKVGLVIRGGHVNGTSAGLAGLHLQAFNKVRVEGTSFENFTTGAGILNEGANTVTLVDVQLDNNKYGIRNVGKVVSGSNYSANAVKMLGGQISGNKTWGAFEDGALSATVGPNQNNYYIGVVFEDNRTNGQTSGQAFIQKCDGCGFIGSYLEYAAGSTVANSIVLGDGSFTTRSTSILGNLFASVGATATIANTNAQHTIVDANIEEAALANFVSQGASSSNTRIGLNNTAAVTTPYTGTDSGDTMWSSGGTTNLVNASRPTIRGMGFNSISGLDNDLRIRTRGGGTNAVTFQNAGAGATVGTVDDNGMATFGPVTFANLGTPGNGKIVSCSDCTIANPCAGGGTGALAKRLNGVWVCN